MPTNDDIGLIDFDAIDSDEPFQLSEPDPIELPSLDPDVLLPLLSDPDPAQRTIGARAFCELQDPRAIEPLMALIDDPCPLVRVSAAYALGRNPDLRAIDPLIRQLQRDWNGYVRKGIVWALGNGRDRRVLDPLVQTLRHDIAAVRLWAASSLGQMGAIGYEAAVGAVPALIVALRQDPVAAVRSNCAWSLGQLCRDLPSNAIYAGAVDGLIEALVEDRELGIKEDARAALLKLGDSRALQIIQELEQEGWL
ncbi:MAG: HEAT repeat domain-containing protein [Oscillatoriales cyanobacterium]|nr:MAG: HEAT repeat domain-containing protein [Oscillatoriales cyanobacterium]